MPLYELLVKNRDSILPAHKPIELDLRGCRKRGNVVALFPSPHEWGRLEALPTFVVIKCDLLESDLENYQKFRKVWDDDFAYEIIDSNAQQGRYTVRVYNLTPGAMNQNGLTAAKINLFLTGWGCSDISYSVNSCTFTFSLWNAVRSPEFWDTPLVGSKVNFALNGYVPSSGVGTISATIVDGQWGNRTEAQITRIVTRKIVERGGVVVSQMYPEFIFTIARSDVLTKFRADVKQKAQKTYMLHQYRINEETMNAAVEAGGVLTVSRNELLAALRDMQVE